jgi:hypothetical protein
MKLFKQYLILFLLIVLANCIYGQNIKSSKLQIRIDYNVNLFHFVDHLSQWSEYTGDDAKKLYTNTFVITDEDKRMLENYSETRNKLGWNAEIDLFNWAYNGFNIDSTVINDSLKEINYNEYVKLKSVIEYFSKRSNSTNSIENVLKEKYSELLKIKPDIEQYTSYLHNTFLDINAYLNLWIDSGKIDYSKYPIYICFSHYENSTHGGANGDGVYAEFEYSKGKEGVIKGFDVIIHELTHKIAKISNYLVEFIKNENLYTKEALNFMKRNNLTQEKLLEIFESIDTLGLGNRESMIFEEINVLFISPVITRNYDDEKVAQIISFFKTKGIREYVRIWYGVQIFKKEYERIDKLDFDKNKFICSLIEIYYEKIYFENYNKCSEN